VDIAVAVMLLYGVDFMVVKLLVVPADNDVMLLAVDAPKPGVIFVVWFEDVNGRDVIPGVVVPLAKVELATKVGEVTADLLLVVDVPGSCSFFEVVLSVVDGDVALGTVEEKVVMTGGVDFLVL